MKPISKWSEDELRRCAERSWSTMGAALAAEVLRLRALLPDDDCICSRDYFPGCPACFPEGDQ